MPEFRCRYFLARRMRTQSDGGVPYASKDLGEFGTEYERLKYTFVLWGLEQNCAQIAVSSPNRRILMFQQTTDLPYGGGE